MRGIKRLYTFVAFLKQKNIVLSLTYLKEMKKLVLFFAVAFAMSFASCGNKAAENTEVVDSVAVEEVVVDSAAVDSCCADSAVVVAE